MSRLQRPQPISVGARTIELFDSVPFQGHEPLLASAFHVGDVDYRWRPGEDKGIGRPAGEGGVNGPAVGHVYPVREWRRVIDAARLQLVAEKRITPFIALLTAERSR